MKTLGILENILHIGGCVLSLYGVIVTIIVIAGFTDSRPYGLHPVQFGLIFAAVFAVLVSVMLSAALLIRKRSARARGR